MKISISVFVCFTCVINSLRIKKPFVVWISVAQGMLHFAAMKGQTHVAANQGFYCCEGVECVAPCDSPLECGLSS